MNAAKPPGTVPDGPAWSRHGAPPPLTAAAALVFVEGLVAFGYGVAEVAHLSSDRVTMGVTTSVFFAATGAGLVACAWGLLRLHTWARGPVLLAQLIALGLAWNFRGDETWGISVALAVPAVVALAGMLHPASVEALERGSAAD